MISKRDSKPFQIKFAIGTLKTNNVDTIYQDEWNTVYGLVSDPNGAVSKYIYGIDVPFDKVIIVNASPVTRAICETTLFAIDNIPSTTYQDGDYTVTRVMPEHNGEIVIAVSKRESVNIPKLYFGYGENVLYYQLNYDKINLKGYVKSNSIIPFSEGDYVWTREPENTSSAKNRLKLVSKKRFGFDKNCKPFIELAFIKE